MIPISATENKLVMLERIIRNTTAQTQFFSSRYVKKAVPGNMTLLNHSVYSINSYFGELYFPHNKRLDKALTVKTAMERLPLWLGLRCRYCRKRRYGEKVGRRFAAVFCKP